MRRNTIGLTLAALAAAGVVGVAGAAVADAADDSASTSTASPSAAPSAGALPGGGEDGADRLPDGRAGGPGGGTQDEVVTGDEAQRVVDAVEAQDSSVTVDTVRKDPDGSYDALGTRDGRPVFYEVSADLTTVTERQGGRGGPGRGCDGDDSAAADGSGGATSNSSSRTSADAASSV